jgi:hypothetical protein
MPKKRQHFVPQHYLRQFRIDESEQVVIATLDPYKAIGPGAIDRQCKEDYFYGKEGDLDKLLETTESEIAPLLVRVVKRKDFDSKELVALSLLAVILHLRTRKEVEAAKVLPKHIADEIIKGAIERGELPAPKGGYENGMIDFEGVPRLLIEQTIPCWMELRTLECKVLKAEVGSYFITSDNPVVVLNQFCACAEPYRSFVGFSRSGFQLLLPVGPELCLFFYDAKVYKVGARRHRLVALNKRDVEIVNSLQIQSADKCLYFHNEELGKEVERMVTRYASLRVPIEDTLRKIQDRTGNETLLHSRTTSVRLSATWEFCRYKRHINFQPGARRDPAWTETIGLLMKDIEQNPGTGDIFERLERILS